MTSKIPLFKVLMAPDAHERVKEVLYSGYVAQGVVVDQFEAALEQQVGKPVVTVNSGTSALELALHIVSVQPGYEVITSPMTCSATTCAIINRGGRPVWADVDRLTGNIDPKDVAQKISERRTRAIVAVDWGGRACDYLGLRHELHKLNLNLPIIEDGAHSFGASYLGQPIAVNGGHFCCFSFQAIKFLTTGDGGALTMPEFWYERARRLRWFGVDRKQPEATRFMNDLPEPGFKFHMNNIAAAIGLANLQLARKAVDVQRENAKTFIDALKGIGDHGRVALPPWDPEASWWIFTLLVEDREKFITHMANRNIAVSPAHSRNDRHSGFDYYNGPLPGLDHFAARNCAIPVHWALTQDERARIVDAVWAFSEGKP